MTYRDNDETQLLENGKTPPLGPQLGPQSGPQLSSPLGPQLRQFHSRRAFWHSAGILLALAVAWLIFRSYRQPDFLIDLANVQFC